MHKSKRALARDIEELQPEPENQKPAFAVQLEDGSLIKPGGGEYDGGAPFILPYELWSEQWAGDWDPREERTPDLPQKNPSK